MKCIVPLILTLAGWQVAFSQTIVIDPGHGGGAYAGKQSERTLSSPNNATSPSGIREKNLCLELSLALEKAIVEEAKRRAKPLEVVLTRRDDVNLDFAERARICAEVAPDAVVSIHFNASGSGQALGTLCVIQGGDRNPEFDRDKEFADGLARACNEGVRQFVPASKPRASIADGYLHGGMGSNFFFQLNRHESLRAIPMCFLEVEFIDRADVEQQLIRRREEAFPVIAERIAAYLVEKVGRDTASGGG